MKTVGPLLALACFVGCGKSGDGQAPLETNDSRCPRGTTVKDAPKTEARAWWHCEAGGGVKQGPALEYAVDDMRTYPSVGGGGSVDMWLKWSGSYRDGKREGKWTASFENTKGPAYEGSYTAGKRNGEWISFPKKESTFYADDKVVDSPAKPADPAAVLPPPPVDPDTANYKSNAELEEALKTGKGSAGKTALISMTLRQINLERSLIGESCESSMVGTLKFRADLSDYVRAMPRPTTDFNGPGSPKKCEKKARVYFQITSVQDKEANGTILKILDVAPVAAEPAPKGADLASLVDAYLLGADAVGKVVEMAAYGDSNKFNKRVRSCLHAGGYSDSPIFVSVPDKLTKDFERIPDGDDFFKKRICRVVQIKLTKADGPYATLEGELVSVGKEVKGSGAADYVSFDKIKLDGSRATGKTARLPMWRGNTDERKFVAYPCEDSAGIDWIDVNFKSDQAEAVHKVGTGTTGCATLTVRLMGRDSLGHFQGALVSAE